MRSIVAADILDVGQQVRQEETHKHEHHEGNERAVIDRVALVLEGLAQGDLEKGQLAEKTCSEQGDHLTKLPMTLPKLKMIQNHEINLPFCFSLG